MFNTLKFSFAAVVFFSFSIISKGQIHTTQGSQVPFTPEILINDVFLGEGVAIESVTFPSDPMSAGYFNTAQSNIDLERGLVLTTGSVTGISWPNFSQGTSVAHTLIPAVSDSDLEILAGNVVQDISKFEIVFRPLSDKLKFRYVFASEEYPEFSCAAEAGSFNDAFGFFLSGPGITGPFSNSAKNLATLPDGITPVSITNVNGGDPNDPTCNGMNSQFFRTNPIGNWMTFDGYLTVMEVVQTVIPCEEYVLKIAIGDTGKAAGIGDNSFDSAIFLEAESFRTNVITAVTSSGNTKATLFEGCGSETITITLPERSSSETVIPITIRGSAQENLDFTLSETDFITIPTGQLTTELKIEALEDNLDDGMKNVIIDLAITSCEIQSFTFEIVESPINVGDFEDEVRLCDINEVTLFPEFQPLGSESLMFENADRIIIPDANQLLPGETVVSELIVSGVEPLILGPNVIESVCFSITHFWNADLNVYLRAPNGSFLELTTDNGGSGNGYDVCFVDDPTVELITEPGTLRPEEPNGDPISGNFRPEGAWGDLWSDESPTNGKWELLVFDDSNGPAFPQRITDFNITFKKPFTQSYSFSPLEGLSCTDCPNPVASPTVDTEYTLSVLDSRGCIKEEKINVLAGCEVVIPTMSQWSVLILGLLIASISLIYIKRQVILTE